MPSDAQSVSPAAATATNNYPRIAWNNDAPRAGGSKIAVEEYEKYMVVSLGGGAISKIVGLKQDLSGKGRSIVALRYFTARAYQGDQASIPWSGTYPGHWLFAAGTTTAAFVGATTTIFPVASAAPFQGYVGHYAMVWNGTALNPALTPDNPAFWNQAEHVKITGVGKTSITVQRGYDPGSGTFSTDLAQGHPAGSRIALHALGATKGPEIWAYNQSTYCPKDAAGRQFNQVMGDWLGQHLNDRYEPATLTYTTYPGAFDGVLFDSTNYEGLEARADVNNDLVADSGVVQAGQNSWGEGLDVMFAAARQALGPNVPLVGGTSYTRGFAYLNGTQFESFPSGSRSRPGYEVWDAALARYFAWQGQAGMNPVSPPYSEVYPACGLAVQGTNADFRFGLGSALLAGGYFDYDNGCYDDYWWDEYSVDLRTGEAVPLSAGVDAIAAHTGYLGQPLGAPQRLLDPTSGTNLLNSGSWTVKTSGGAAATLNTVGTTVSVSITQAGRAPGDVVLRYRPISLVGGQEYTLTFWAKADNGRTAVDLGRDVDLAVGAPGGMADVGKEFITPAWRQYWVNFVAPVESTNASIVFRVDLEEGNVQLDQVGLYQGTSSLYRRDFQNGIVMLNGTWQTQTVDLGGTFRKIKGTQDPAVNDGGFVTSVTLAPHDAIILLRSQLYNVNWQSHDTPTTMTTAARYTVHLSFANAGSLTWQASGINAVNLSYHWRNGACPGTSYALWDGLRTHLPDDIPPGGQVSALAAQVRAPASAGTYCLVYDLVRERVTWFEAQGSPTLQVTVTVEP
jgi:hypothetical protein